MRAKNMESLLVRLASAFHLDFRLAYVLPSIVLLLASGLMFRRRSS